MSEPPPRGTYVHDLRHRYSYELRPTPAHDAELRGLATALEHAGLVPTGASAKPRFHPHVTLLRAARFEDRALVRAARAVARTGAGAVEWAGAATFGSGRIVYLTARDDRPFHAARAALLAELPHDEVDPLVFTREWSPHLTLAYSVPEPTRRAALEFVAARLPLAGAFADVQSWDLDVRPTVQVAGVQLPDADG